MDKITTIIVDDEINARENLTYLLELFCKNIHIVGEAKNVDDAVSLIKDKKPQLVFLDIEMPQKNGFQLFEAFKKINFQVIFITAYDKYAINAFKVSAVDYLLKPIDINLLKLSIKKVEKLIVNKKLKNKIDLLTENRKKIKKIAIPYKSDYVIIDVNDIACIEAERMYSNIKLHNGKTYTASKKLSYYEDILSNSEAFIRIHRSWMVNTNHIYSYSKKEKNIKLTNNISIPVSKSYKEKFENLFNSINH
ncbi:LytTR family DNA-binding domain-containing protein [uncultured Polaribacter sp.]|uniref:LytR/AlgR family response regulator transcription factor n=1 Tax=uncultured Polaribacter sp. TaxID=174711 RepID=UPI002612C443|nr:LytTR family DNA-binding domain-containing protein [uncultured Polaribacter sp.]